MIKSTRLALIVANVHAGHFSTLGGMAASRRLLGLIAEPTRLTLVEHIP
jgi:hypothetical protein